MQANIQSCVASAELNNEKPSSMSLIKLQKKFGQSQVFITSALKEDGGVPEVASPAYLLQEAIQVISCGYEDKTEWGKEVSMKRWFVILRICFLQVLLSFTLLSSNFLYANRLAGYMVRLLRIF